MLVKYRFGKHSSCGILCTLLGTNQKVLNIRPDLTQLNLGVLPFANACSVKFIAKQHFASCVAP